MIEIPWDAFTLGFVFAVVLGSCALSVVVGFGLGMIAAPLLLLVLPPSEAVTIIKVIGIGTVWIALVPIRREIRWGTVWRILPAAAVGLVVGGLILREVEAGWIRIAVGVLVIVSAISLVMRPIMIARDAVWSTSLVGFLTGVMGNATGLLAPAVVVYFTGRRFPRDVFRATIMAVFTLIEVIGLPTLLVQGAVSGTDVRLALLTVPVAVVGRVVGMALVRHVSQEAFRRMTLGLLVVMAVVSLASGLREVVL